MKPTWLASIKWQIVWQAAYPPAVLGSHHAEFGSTEIMKWIDCSFLALGQQWLSTPVCFINPAGVFLR
jgi:hypothetical protein